LEYAVTWAFGPLFLPFILVFGASFLAILWIGANVVRSGVTDHFADGFPRRSWAAINVAMSGLLTVLWLGRIAAGLQGDLLTAGLTSETTLTVQALDLGLVVPVSLLSAFLAWRRVPVGQVLAAAWSVTFVAMAAAIVSMLISAGLVEGQFEIAPMAIFGVAALAAAAIGLRMYRGLGPGRPPRPAASVATTAASAGGG
ncbi:MAG TPA: hypothetical protein VFY43_06765, partial [Candidatus Limnocylindria bacterium]|nr:hypothetical protein [Candidatus Limnocylindria bacterium]